MSGLYKAIYGSITSVPLPAHPYIRLTRWISLKLRPWLFPITSCIAASKVCTVGFDLSFANTYKL